MGDYPTTDCYEILGVEQDATYGLSVGSIPSRIDVIKKAYRKLALKWHPGNVFSRVFMRRQESRPNGGGDEAISDDRTCLGGGERKTRISR